jgi:hypothetical protein
MQKHSIISLSKEEIFKILAKHGVVIPDDGYISMEEDGSGIEIRWSEQVRPAIKHPEDALSQFTLGTQLAIKRAIEDNRNIIPAIKALRAEMGWSLASAKEWVDSNYPR